MARWVRRGSRREYQGSWFGNGLAAPRDRTPTARARVKVGGIVNMCV